MGPLDLNMPGTSGLDQGSSAPNASTQPSSREVISSAGPSLADESTTASEPVDSFGGKFGTALFLAVLLLLGLLLLGETLVRVVLRIIVPFLDGS